jgi:hypothetical protein
MLVLAIAICCMLVLAAAAWVVLLRRDMVLHETMLTIKLFSDRGSVRKDTSASAIHSAFMGMGNELRIVVGPADDVNCAFLGLALRKAFNDLVRDGTSPAEDDNSIVCSGLFVRKALNRMFGRERLVSGPPQKLHLEFMSDETKSLEKQVSMNDFPL